MYVLICTPIILRNISSENPLTYSTRRTDNFKPPAVANAPGVIQQAASTNEYYMQLTSEVRSSLSLRPDVG